ncbi:MAG: hypothetical protein P8X73_07850 [Ignavibacteriaceae bacterium]
MKFFSQTIDFVSLNPKRILHVGSRIDEGNNQMSNINKGVSRIEKRVLKSKIKFILGVVYFLSLVYSLILLLS